MHCLRPASWAGDYQSLQDGFSEAQQKKIIRTKGASIHGLPALRTIPGNEWLEIAMIRMNHNGTRMDNQFDHEVDISGNVDEVVAHTKKVHTQGLGVISMKLVGEGRFHTWREIVMRRGIKPAMNLKRCWMPVTI